MHYHNYQINLYLKIFLLYYLDLYTLNQPLKNLDSKIETEILSMGGLKIPPPYFYLEKTTESPTLAEASIVVPAVYFTPFTLASSVNFVATALAGINNAPYF